MLTRTWKRLGLILVAALVATPLLAQQFTVLTNGTGAVGRLLTGVAAPVAQAGSAVEWTTRAVTLTNAQVLALGTTAIEVVPAPGTGFIHEPIGGLLLFNRTGAYTETGGDDNFRLYYVDSSGAAASNVMETTGFVDAAGDAILTFGPVPNDTLITVAGQLSNAAIVVSGVVGGTYTNLGGGNAANTIRVVVAYRTHRTGL